MEQVKAFMEMAQTDSELAAKLEELSKKTKEMGDIIALAAEYGFVFTAEDLKAAKCGGCQGSRELSEEELDNVSGGWTVDKYDPKKCKGLTKIRDSAICTGLFYVFWPCSHFSETYIRSYEKIGYKGGLETVYVYVNRCNWNAFPPYETHSYC